MAKSKKKPATNSKKAEKYDQPDTPFVEESKKSSDAYRQGAENGDISEAGVKDIHDVESNERSSPDMTIPPKGMDA